MAKSGYGKYDAWSQVSGGEESTTNANLIESTPSLNTQPVKKKPCISFTWFFLLVLVICVMFLLGTLLGYYVRESQIYDSNIGNKMTDFNRCLISRKNNEDGQKLESIHEDVMYFLTGERISNFVKDYGGLEDPQLDSVLEKKLQSAVIKAFEKYSFDNIESEKHHISVTYPHSTKPNKLEISKSSKNIKTFILENQKTVLKNKNTEADATFPYVAFSHSGSAEGRLLYANYGRLSDFLLIQYNALNLSGSILLIKLGQISVREKILSAVTYGVKGILLYWDKMEKDPSVPHDTSVIPFVSAGPYSDEHDLPMIPVQTISTDQANWLFESMTGSVCPDSWQSKAQCKFNHRTTDNVTVHISTYNEEKEKVITNIIGTINGQDEQDRYAIVGAPRSAFSTDENDVISSTALILQLARSLSYVQGLQNWKPKRTIKMISWGGAEFTNTGLHLHIENHKELLKRRAIAYFDVSQLLLGNDSIGATMSPAFQQLLSIVTTKVPDPKDPEISVHDKLMAVAGDLFVKIPFTNYNKDTSRDAFIHKVGVPAIHLQYVGQNQITKSMTTMLAEERHHHYKYHATVGRVIVLVLLRLVDDNLLPYSIEDYCRDLHLNLWTASEQLTDCSKNKINLNDVVSKVNGILQTNKIVQDYINKYLTVDNFYSIRGFNDQKLLLDKLFLVSHNGSTYNILYPVDGDGLMTRVGELCRIGKLTEDWSQAKQLQKRLGNILEEMDRSLRLSG